MHVKETKWVGRVLSNRFGFAGGTEPKVRLIAVQFVTEGIRGGCACPAGIFPLRLGR